jgi:glycosyltransferase involved in cell wall biosynthesis
MGRSQARAELGLPEHATVFVLFGRIAPYKGVTELVEAVDRLARSRPGEIALVLAGDPVPGVGVDELYDKVAAHPAIHGAFRKIPDPQVQVFLRAADAMALPYRRSLNSGALNLALTFGLPVVLPRSSGEADGADPAWAEVYDDGAEEDGSARVDALQDALARAMDRFGDGTAGTAARAAAAAVPPPLMAERFASTVRTWLSTGQVPDEVRA